MTEAISNTYRFFVSPDVIHADLVRLDDADLIHQIGRVLRLRAGSRVLLLDGLGTAYVVTLTDVGRGLVTGQIEQRVAASGEPSLELTLYVGLMRAERFEWVLQKGTELGVTTFVPVQFSRSQAADQVSDRKQARWQRIVREAAEQACRGRLPVLLPLMSLEQACAAAAQAELALLLWEGKAPALRSTLRIQPAVPTSVAVLSGPEGGITPAELTSTAGHGIISISLGPRILRAETAPIAASAAILYEFEDEQASDQTHHPAGSVT